MCNHVHWVHVSIQYWVVVECSQKVEEETDYKNSKGKNEDQIAMVLRTVFFLPLPFSSLTLPSLPPSLSPSLPPALRLSLPPSVSPSLPPSLSPSLPLPLPPSVLRCIVERSSSGIEVTSPGGKAVVTFNPFQVAFSVNGEIAVMLNSRGLFNFEHYRTKRWVWLLVSDCGVVVCVCLLRQELFS